MSTIDPDRFVDQKTPIEQQSEKENDKADEHERIASRTVFQIIRREGEAEIARPNSSLFWSGLAAGMAITFSLLFEAMLRVGLPDLPYRPLIENFGYTAGFLLVILGRMQLFTENTITAVLPVLERPCPKVFLGMGRLWGIVLVANVIGTAIAAFLIANGGMFEPEVRAASIELGEHVAGWGPYETFLKALPAGFLIAALVWLLPASEGQEFWVIVLFTYIIALGDFAHVIVGSGELALLAFVGAESPIKLFVENFLPTLAGNIVGGTGIFAILVWAQVREEV